MWVYPTRDGIFGPNSIKAALFTAIVTAFVLDVMSDLDENTATTLLRILVEQSTANSTSTTKMPSPDPSSSTLMVSSLWFLSIMSSLAATTWAILCLEWCAFLTDGVQAEDYEEMAEKRQHRFEAVIRWKMHLIVAAIPFFLHLSLFLFLAGLWLRLRHVNTQLGLIVGVPSLVIVLSYVVVTLLPIFTDAPFSTSASEFIKPIVDWIGRIAEFGRSIRPPPLFVWIARLLPVGDWHRIFVPFSFGTRRLSAFLKGIYRTARRCIYTLWKTIALLPIVPTFELGQNPFDELNKLKVGRSDRGKGIQLRALFWLMNTPLSQDEVKEILKEFRNHHNPKEPLDRTIIRLLVLSLSSVLDDNRISEDEQPIFDHCTTTLAGEMDRAFGDGKHSQRILFRNTAIPEKLLPHFRLTTSDEGTSTHIGHPSSETNRGEDYWKRMSSALWLCSSTETIRSVVDQLDSNIQTIRAKDPSLLKMIVHGLHVATPEYFNPEEFNHELIPDFSIWNWDHSSPNQSLDLDKALSGYLQCLFAAFYKTITRSSVPTTATSLIVDCLKELDSQSNPDTIRLHNALCFFVVVTQRSDPKVFEEGQSRLAHALLESAESWKKYSGEDDSMGAKVLAARLNAIAYGPRPLVFGQNRPLTRLSDLYAGLPDSIKTDRRCLEGFLNANAATMEAVLSVGGRLSAFAWQHSFKHRVVQLTDHNPNPWFTPSVLDFVRQHPNHRLPYLYSLAIRLSHTIEERNYELWKVANLLVTDDEQGRITIDRALDTNILVAIVLRFAQQGRSGIVEREWREIFLGSLGKAIVHGTDWRTSWKSIYLIADLVVLLSQTNIRREGEEQRKALIDVAGKAFERVKHEPVPSDWQMKRDGLTACGLRLKVKELSAQVEVDEAIFRWSDPGTIPYLSLYNSPHTMYWAGAFAMFQQ